MTDPRLQAFSKLKAERADGGGVSDKGGCGMILRELSTPFAPTMALQSSHDSNPEQITMIDDSENFWTPEDDEHAAERAAMTAHDRAIEVAVGFFGVEVEAELETATLH